MKTGRLIGFLALLIGAHLSPQAAWSQPTTEYCHRSAAADRGATAIREAAQVSRLAEFFRLHARLVPTLARDCGWPEAHSQTVLLGYIGALSTLGRLADVDQIAARALAEYPVGQGRTEFRLQLLNYRLGTAVVRRDGPMIVRRYSEYVDERGGNPDPKGLVDTLNWVRRCIEHNIARLACRDGETTALYGEFSYERVPSGNLELSGQCPSQVPIPEEMLGEGAILHIIARPALALNASCRRERDMAPLVRSWWQGVNGTAPRDTRDAGRLIAELTSWADEIDGFDRDNAVTRFQVRALIYFVRATEWRIACGHCIAWRSAEIEAQHREREELRPFFEAALPHMLAGEEGFLRVDTVGLTAYIASQAYWMSDAERAEIIWRLVGLSFGDERARSVRPLVQVRAALDDNEVLVTALHPIDGTGVVMAVDRGGRVFTAELDAAAKLTGDIAEMLLNAVAHPPDERSDFPLAGARYLYDEYVCPAEILHDPGRPGGSIVFVPDAMMERVPLTLLARPVGGCVNADIDQQDAYRLSPGSGLASVRWVGDDYDVRVMPFEAVNSGTNSGQATGYLGVGAPLTRTIPLQISVASTFASPLRQQSDLAAALPTLPGARDELNAAANLLGSHADAPLIGAQATEDNLRRAAVRPHRIVHFATHALDPSLNPLILEPLLVLTRPETEPFETANDGVLTSSEISGLHFPGAIVLLSACRTAAPRHGLGAGLFSGLVQAFFQAGAVQAMATYWTIDDDATARLVVAIASRLERGQPVWTAVREAQMEFRRNRLQGAPPFWNHPYYWGAFVAVSPNLNSPGH